MIKRTVFFVVMAAFAVFPCAAGGGKESPAAAHPSSGSSGGPAAADISYAAGMLLGMILKENGMIYDFNYTELLNGVRDVVEGKRTRLTEEEAGPLVQNVQMEAQARIAEENRRSGEAFLAENRKRPGVTVTASGLQYETVPRGTGVRPVADDTVRINYELALVDGTVLESSFEAGQSIDLPLGSDVMPGFNEGLQLMTVGSTYILYMPPALAYGEYGGGGIPPNATLVFKIELLSIVP
jgi:FKBP-type peptidyl-prolyl cis-trans isomerase